MRSCRSITPTVVFSCLLLGCAGAGQIAGERSQNSRLFTPGREFIVRLPGPEYKVLHSGPTAGRKPLRSDDVMIRYVGRLEDGSIFSTSANQGTEPSKFSVRTVIPGFSALVQLMRPGDRWQFTIPSYLGYGHQGRAFTPPEATLKRDIPPNSTLVFDVELVSVEPSQ